MPVVVDTMVFAYALLGIEPFYERAFRAIYVADAIVVPDGVFAELADVTWQWVRASHVPLARAQALVHLLRPLISEVVPTTAVWGEAIQLSVDRHHPVYDTIFVAVAISRDAKVVTFDQKMLDRFPDVAISCDDFLAQAPARP